MDTHTHEKACQLVATYQDRDFLADSHIEAVLNLRSLRPTTTTTTITTTITYYYYYYYYYYY